MPHDQDLELRLIDAGGAKTETNGSDAGIPEVDADQLFEG